MIDSRIRQNPVWELYKRAGRSFGVSDKSIYYTYALLGGTPFGYLQRASDSYAQMDAYLRNRGLSYGNIRYPTGTTGYGVSNALNFVSETAKLLYR